MGIFESDNIWKKRARKRRQAASPNAQWEEWKRKRDSNILWLGSAALLIVLYLIAIAMGTIALDLPACILLGVLACYCVTSVSSLKKHMDSEPEKRK